MFSRAAAYNLKRDKKVLGKEWLKTYGNYFSNEENITMFIKAVKPLLPRGPLEILYVASASGLLGERLLEKLGQGRLTLVDISNKHLRGNTNPETKKICADLLKLDLRKQFDVVIMRSSLDYFPTTELQIRVLKIIRKHLKSGGLFVNQPAYITNLIDRDKLDKVYNQTPNIGNRHFQSKDIKEIHKSAGFSYFKKIGTSKDLIITEKEHVERYNIGSKDIFKIQETIGKNSRYARVTRNGYILRFKFPIFLAK